ncbi:unnamed protein product, partial [Adineta steineri]
ALRTDIEHDERQTIKEISPVVETITEEHEVPTEDTVKEADRISSEALTDAVREIIATPLTKQGRRSAPVVEEKTEKIQEVPAIGSDQSSTAAFEQQVTKEQEESILRKAIEQDEKETVNEVSSSVTEHVEETTTKEQEVS